MSKPILDNGEYHIYNGQRLLQNFPDSGWHPPFITGVIAGQFAGVYCKWILRHVSEGAYSLTNVGTGYRAYVSKEIAGAHVNGNSDAGTHFAVERAGDNEYTIKAVNDDLEWTVNGNDVVLEASGKGASQHFRFEFLGPL